jgi:hypothetical protein
MMMRTTVTLDDDTEALVRERMRARGVSFKTALNDAIREGSTIRTGFETPEFAMGVPLVDLDKALRLAGELEDEDLARGMRRGA